jgi:hypothetical protein
MCTHDGNGVTTMKVERVTDITEKVDQESTTIPVIKTEPKVSCMSVLNVCTFHIGCIQNCWPLYQTILVKQKFDSREWVLSSL